MTKRVPLLSVLSSCSIFMAASLGASHVQAGFEWVPADQATPPALQKPQEVITPEPQYAAPQMSEMHVETTPAAEPVKVMHHVAVTPEGEAVVGEEDMPMPVTEDVAEAEVQTEEVAVIETEVIEAPVEAEEVVVVEEEIVVYEETMPKKEYAMAYGFGKEMPLALALRQIVPASYAFSFDPAVKVGTRVSWQGGEAWNIVLKKALLNQNLAATVYDDMVLVRPSTHADAVDVSEVESAPEMAVEEEASAAPAELAVEADQPAYFDASHSWTAAEGQTLRGVLAKWSDKVGVELHWDNLYDFPVVSNWTYEGDYVHAVDGLLTAFENETPKPAGRLHPNAPQGPAVLVVSVTSAK